MRKLSIQTLEKKYTLDEYWELEEVAEERHEFHDGRLVVMAGGTFGYSMIAANLNALLKSALKGSPCRAVNGDLRIWVPQRNLGIYPDGLVIKGEPIFNGMRRDEITNPCLALEVLSRFPTLGLLSWATSNSSVSTTEPAVALRYCDLTILRCGPNISTNTMKITA
ncbi:MAG: Uma2 family endonuclease [Cyanobacteria bacterium J06554_11]